MSNKFSAFDPAEYLDSDEAIAAYINEVIADGDDDLFLSALSDIARARGMTQVAIDSGLGRESLYKALKPGAKPGFFTISKVIVALGINLRVAAKSTKSKAGKELKATKAGKSKATKQTTGAVRKRAAA